MALLLSALPYPPQTRRKLDALRSNSASRADLIEKLRAGRDALRYQLDLIESDLSALSSLNESSSTDHAELSEETKEQTFPEQISKLRQRVGQLGWNEDMAASFQAIDDSPGNVSGKSWTNGFLLSTDLFLTTAHSLAGSGNGWQWPRRGGRDLLPSELAELFNVRLSDELLNDKGSGHSSSGSTNGYNRTITRLVTGMIKLHETEGELILLRLLKQQTNVQFSGETPSGEPPLIADQPVCKNKQLYLLPFAQTDAPQSIKLNNSATTPASESCSIKKQYIRFQFNHCREGNPPPGQRKWLSGSPIVDENGALVAMYLAQEFSTNINYAIRIPDSICRDIATDKVANAGVGGV